MHIESLNSNKIKNKTFQNVISPLMEPVSCR